MSHTKTCFLSGLSSEYVLNKKYASQKGDYKMIIHLVLPHAKSIRTTEIHSGVSDLHIFNDSIIFVFLSYLLKEFTDQLNLKFDK